MGGTWEDAAAPPAEAAGGAVNVKPKDPFEPAAPPHADPLSTMFPLASHFAQFPEEGEPLAVAKTVVLPLLVPAASLPPLSKITGEFAVGDDTEVVANFVPLPCKSADRICVNRMLPVAAAIKSSAEKIAAQTARVLVIMLCSIP